MKKIIVSWKLQDAAWLEWGRKQLSILKSIGLSRKDYMVEEELLVRVNTTGAESVEVLRLPSHYYFGFGASVASRCWCRGIAVLETAAPLIAVTLTQENYVFLGNIVGYANYTADIVARVGGIEVGRVQSSLTTSGGTGSDHSAPVRSSINVASNTSGGAGNRPTPYALLSENPSFIMHGTIPNETYTVSSYNSVWSTPFDAAIADSIAARSSAANYRSAVFATDGNELASALIGNPDVWSTANTGTAINVMPYTNTWRGDDTVPLFTYTHVAGQSPTYARGVDLKFTVPDDACYQKVPAPPYPGVASAASAALALQWEADWNAAQKIALQREHKRLASCADAQIALLRHGVIPAEVDYFARRNHPLSALLVRDIPMVVETYSTVRGAIVPGPAYGDATIEGVVETGVTTVSITLKYDVTDADGKTTTVRQPFEGTLTEVLMQAISTNPSDNHIQYYVSTYSKYPNIATQVRAASGMSLSLDSKLVNPVGTYVHDEDNLEQLFTVRDGVETESPWITSSRFGTAVLQPQFMTHPTLPITSNTAVDSHPQFVIDYVKTSVPLESTMGNKKIASKNWLSSRLSHGELITYVPFFFVGEKGEAIGSQLQVGEIPLSVEIRGYASFRYDYYKATFTFAGWAEFTDKGKQVHAGDATYDKETAPTTVTIDKIPYKLSPQKIAYNVAWGSANCVCIADRAIWTDTATKYKTQKAHNASTYASSRTPEETLYAAVKKMITDAG
jgi:hypothetical protein